MQRLYQAIIQEHFDSYDKMLFLAGPRQVGKTTIGKAVEEVKNKLSFHPFHYLNWDNSDDRKLIEQGPNIIAQQFGLNELAPLNSRKTTLVFDEVHKSPRWKNFLKGFFDVYRERVQILVTGSAKLDVYRSGGDSLRGRYFLYRVHPFSIAECVRTQPNHKQEISSPLKIATDDFQVLLDFGGFPEPFLERNRRFYNRWKKLTYHQLFREEVRDLSRIQEVASLEKLAEFIRAQTGQLTNYSALSVKLGVSVHTIKQWIETLVTVYYSFVVTPWSKNVARSLLKQPKIYLWDWSNIEDEGARLENFVACHLLKAVHFWTDSGFGDYELHFVRDKEGREVDFLVTKDNRPWFLVEVKKSRQTAISKNLYYFHEQLNTEHAFQVVFDMPYIEQDCFVCSKNRAQPNRPIIVPAQTLFAQMV